MKKSRKARRSTIVSSTKLNLATGLAGALALASGAMAQTTVTGENSDQTVGSDTTYSGASPLYTLGTAGNAATNTDVAVSTGVKVQVTGSNVVFVQNDSSSANSLTNSGTITTDTSALYAVAGTSGTSLTNSGKITATGSGAAINIQGTVGTVANTGTIENTGTGVAILVTGGVVSNTGTGTITSASSEGISVSGLAAKIVGNGSITSASHAISVAGIAAGGTINTTTDAAGTPLSGAGTI